VFRDLIKRIAEELAGRNIPYMIIGGQAVLLYGEPRLTRDIDVTVGLGIDGLEKITEAVKALGLAIQVANVEDFVGKTMVLPTLDGRSGIRVDFIFSFSAYERQAIERAKEVKFDSTPVRFASLEDVVIHKLVAGRARDIEDVVTVLLKNPGYDKKYIQDWLADFDQSLGGNHLPAFEEIISNLRA